MIEKQMQGSDAGATPRRQCLASMQAGDELVAAGFASQHRIQRAAAAAAAAAAAFSFCAPLVLWVALRLASQELDAPPEQPLAVPAESKRHGRSGNELRTSELGGQRAGGRAALARSRARWALPVVWQARGIQLGLKHSNHRQYADDDQQQAGC